MTLEIWANGADKPLCTAKRPVILVLGCGDSIGVRGSVAEVELSYDDVKRIARLGLRDVLNTDDVQNVIVQAGYEPSPYLQRKGR